MSIITIALISIFIIFIVMTAIAFKFPKGRIDWPLDRRTSASILLSVLVFVLLIILSYFASQHVNWPENTTIFYYVSIVIFVILIIASILLPKGLEHEEFRD